jgi:hypothetical protein
MQAESVSKLCVTVMNFFGKTVAQVDKAVQFVKRKPKVDAQLFVEVLISGHLSDVSVSLEKLCMLIKARGVKMSRQALDQRFTAEATLLMKGLLSEALQRFREEKEEVLDLLKRFSGVKMIDSSGIELPANLKERFKGYGGGASEAAIKLQTMLNYTRGQIDEVVITDTRTSDQGFKEYWNWINEGALYLQDLGYFAVKFFEQVQEKKAYFISRYLNPTTLLDKEGKPLNLLNELRSAGSVFEKKVWLGKKGSVDIRLIAFRLSDEEVEKRIRKLKEKAQKKGKNPTQETTELTKWSIYMTNVPEDWLNAEQVHLVYTLRWQIELFFKVCKSEAGIDKISSKKTDRVLCEIYAKLICVVILMYLCFPVRWCKTQELSLCKAYKTLRLKAFDFFKALKSPYRFSLFIKSFLSDLNDFALKDKSRKKRRLTHQKIMDSAGQEAFA